MRRIVIITVFLLVFVIQYVNAEEYRKPAKTAFPKIVEERRIDVNNDGFKERISIICLGPSGNSVHYQIKVFDKNGINIFPAKLGFSGKNFYRIKKDFQNPNNYMILIANDSGLGFSNNYWEAEVLRILPGQQNYEKYMKVKTTKTFKCCYDARISKTEREQIKDNIINNLISVMKTKKCPIETELIRISEGNYYDLSLSNSQDELFFFKLSVHDENGMYGIFNKISINDGSITTLSSRHFLSRYRMFWSQDKRKIMFSNSKGTWIYDFTYSKERFLGKNLIPFAWSPDDTKVICAKFTETVNREYADYYIIDIESNRQTIISSKQFAYWEAEIFWIDSNIFYFNGPTDVRNAYLQKFDSQSGNLIDKKFAFGVFGNSSTISPNGKKLVFSVIAKPGGLAQYIKIIDLDSKKKFPTGIKSGVKNIAWIDEDKFIFVQWEGGYQKTDVSSIYLYDLKTKKKTLILYLYGSSIDNIVWSPKTEELYFMRQKESKRELCKIKIPIIHTVEPLEK